MYLSKKIASLPIRRAQYMVFATDLAFLCWLDGLKIFATIVNPLSLRGKAGLQTLGTFISMNKYPKGLTLFEFEPRYNAKTYCSGQGIYTYEHKHYRQGRMVVRSFSFIVHMYEGKNVAELSEFALFSRKIHGYYLDIHANYEMAGCKIKISEENKDGLAVAVYRHIRKNEQDKDVVFVKMF